METNRPTATQILTSVEGQQADLVAEGLTETGHDELWNRLQKAMRLDFLMVSDYGLFVLTPKGQAYVASHKD